MELSSTWQQMEANKATKDIFMIPAPVMTNGLHFPAYRLNLLTAPNDDGTETEAFSAGSGEEYGDADIFWEARLCLAQSNCGSNQCWIPPCRDEHDAQCTMHMS